MSPEYLYCHRCPLQRFAKVDHPAVATVGLADTAAKSVFRFRNHDEVNMVGHEAVGSHLHAALRAPVRHQRDVFLIIVVTEERFLPAITPLGNVMRKTRSDNSSDSWHEPYSIPPPRPYASELSKVKLCSKPPLVVHIRLFF